MSAVRRCTWPIRTPGSIGLGAVWIGERYDTKDLPSLASAIGQVTRRVGIGAAVTSPGLRHPMVLASMGQTLQALTGERFLLGLGRSAEWRWRSYGVASPTLASLADTAGILRDLWAGRTVHYDGPAGHFPEIRLAQLSGWFDQLAAFQNFLIMPLTFLSGVFYSTHTLPPVWREVSRLNPFFYMIDGFRYGFFGVSDIDPLVSLGIVAGFFVVLAVVAMRMLASGFKLRH